MPSTFTPDKLNLELLATGEADGTWGEDTNANLSQIGLGLSGEFSVALASSDVEVSLANCANLVLNCTGTLGANVAVKVQQKRGFYIVKNATTGSFSVTVKTTNAGSTGIAVPQGKSAILWTDGTNVYDATSMSTLGALAYLATITSASLISDGIITFAKMASGAVQPYGALVTAAPISSGAANYNLAAADMGNMIDMTSASANTVTFPANATTPIDINKWVFGSQGGTGQTTLTPAGGVTFQAAGSRFKTASQYSGWAAHKVATNTWRIYGDLVA